MAERELCAFDQQHMHSGGGQRGEAPLELVRLQKIGSGAAPGFGGKQRSH